MISSIRPWNIPSVATVIAAIAVISIIGPVWGIDFTGGSLLEFTAQRENAPKIRSHIESTHNLHASVQPTQEGTVLVRVSELSADQHAAIVSSLKDATLIEGDELRFEGIGPSIGAELRRKSVTAILVVMGALVAYLAYAFRSASGHISAWKFGVSALWALIHDLLVISAVFVVFGYVWQVPIDTLFVTAQLAILGYSVNDTIVLFHRVKTNLHDSKSTSLLDNVRGAMRATLARSFNTSLTTLLVLVALLIFSSVSIRWFVVALMMGTVVGTYSSLFVAAPALLHLTRNR